MTDSAHAYEHHAKTFLERRDASLVGTKIVEQWCKQLPAGATGLELACGGGYPITHVLNSANVNLWAIDASPTLVAAFSSRFPHIPIQCERVQTSDFFNRRFDFVVAIGLIFLLEEPDQKKLIVDVARLLEPGGRWLLTAPVETGQWTDTLSGTQCTSLGVDRYRQHFHKAGLHVKALYEDHGKNNYYDLVST